MVRPERRDVLTQAAPLLLPICVAACVSAQTPPCKATGAGTIELVGSTSRVFHNERYLRVWLPPGYSDKANVTKQYPALYMMDGQTVFDGCAETGDGSSWKIDRTLSQLIEKGAIPPLIAIGVDQMGVSRPYEYLPYRDPVSDPDATEPAGKQFPEFMARDVVPLINSRHRIAKGSAGDRRLVLRSRRGSLCTAHPPGPVQCRFDRESVSRYR